MEGARAWLVVLGAHLVHVAVLGCLYGLFGVTADAIATEFAVNRATVSLLGVINLACFQGLGIVSGPLADRFGSRPVMSVGTVFWGLGLVACSFATEFGHLIAGTVLVGMGTAFTYFSCITVVPQWFDKHRGLATSLAVLGSGIGNLIFSLGGQGIVSSGLGWRNTFRVFAGAGVAVLVVAIALVKRRYPPQKAGGLFGTARELIHLTNYRLFLLATFLFQFGFFIPWAEIYFFAIDHGVDGPTASLAVAMLGIGSSAGRIVWGPLADWLGRMMCFRFTMLMAAVTMATWPSCTTAPSILTFAFMYSFFSGGFIAMSPLISADLWGAHRLGGTLDRKSVV